MLTTHGAKHGLYDRHRNTQTHAGYKTGWLGMSWSPKGFKGTIYTAGYPGDKKFGSMWGTTCRVADAKGSDSRFTTLCDVAPGAWVCSGWQHRAGGSLAALPLMHPHWFIWCTRTGLMRSHCCDARTLRLMQSRRDALTHPRRPVRVTRVVQGRQRDQWELRAAGSPHP